MARVFIDQRAYDTAGNQNMLEVCLNLGIDLTYFCWHPALHSVGACRQCAVLQYRDEQDQKGRITMACMLPAADGTRIGVQVPAAKAFRAANIESLMLNHPHDCPVCDEGGECHLQDMTLMSGHNYRRTRFPKRTHLNQYLGPFVHHEMNRCIQCYRCVRYYQDYAGGKDLDVFGCHDDVYFGRSAPGRLENEFSGNLVEICPTGVFTDKTLRAHYTRKWDLTSAPSVCHQCSVGCNILAGERAGVLRRILTRYHADVNGYFLCDRGRFGYGYVNSPARIRTPMERVEGKLCPLGVREALEGIAALLGPGRRVIGIGSPRASLESNFLLRRLVGSSGFYGGFTAGEGRMAAWILETLLTGSVPTPSLAEIRASDAVLVLGEDLTNTAPMMALALRQAVKNEPLKAALAQKIAPWNDAALREAMQHTRGPLYMATPGATKLDEVSRASLYGTPEEIARLGLAVAGTLGGEAAGDGTAQQDWVEEVARVLRAAEKPLVVSGTSLGSEAIVRAASAVAEALLKQSPRTGLAYALSEVNTLGLAMLTTRTLEDLSSGPGPDVLIVLENDLFRRMEPAAAGRLLESAGTVVVLDHLETPTTAKADWVLPAGTFAESDGTVVSQEGRAQRFYRVYDPGEAIRSSWAWLDALSQPEHRSRPLDAVLEQLSAEEALFAPLKDIAPPATFRIGTQRIPRQPLRYSGRTAMHAQVSVHELPPPADPDSPLGFTMEGYRGVPPPADIPFYWVPGWNSVQAMNWYQQEAGGALKGGDPGVRLVEPGHPVRRPAGEDFGGPAAEEASGGLLVVPVYHLFGSEELSTRSAPVAECTSHPYLSLHERDANKAGVSPGERIALDTPGRTLRLELRLDNTLPEGVAGLCAGWPETAGIRFPFRGAIHASG